MPDELMTLKVAQSALREMLFYADRYGTAGAQASKARAEKAIRMIQDRLDESGRHKDVFSLAEGDVIIQCPKTLSPDSFQDFENWLKVVKRKIKRSVSSQVTDLDKAGNQT